MNGGWEKKLGIVATLLLAMLLLFVHYGAVLRAPNSYMFNTEGDGLKNYFSFAWHVEHDTSAFTFSGMNAPFGEHINYPDAQPLLSNLWRAVDALFPAASEYSVGVENLLMLVSLLFSALFLFLILYEHDVRWWVAALAAVLIALLSMQVLRTVQAHYALAYSWCIPSTIWLGLRHFRAVHPWRSMGLLFVVLSAWLWIHVYLGFIAAITLLLWGVLAAPFRLSWTRRASLLLAPITALGLFQVITALTDTHTGRTEHPVGFFTHQTNWTTLFIPDHMWDAPLVSVVWGDPSAENPESWSYLGAGNLLMLGAVLVLGLLAVLITRWRIRPTHVLPERKGALSALLIASVLLLMLAFGMPFDLGFEGLFWKTPVIRQFRAPSRFAWVFYFVLSTYLVIILWKWQHAAADRAVRWLPRGLLVLGLSLMAYEGWHLHRFIGTTTVDAPNYFREDLLPKDIHDMVLHARSTRTVAIASIPYFHNGAEELMIPVDGQGLFLGQVIAYHTGIPMMSSSLTRTGLEEVRVGIRAFGPTWYDRPQLPPWNANDTLLVIIAREDLNPYDRSIMERAVDLRSFGITRIGKLAVGDLLRDDRQRMREDLIARYDSLPVQGAWRSSAPGAFLYHDSFEQLHHAEALVGHGAFTGLKKDFNVLTAFPPNTFDTANTYIASFWYYNRGPMRCHAFVGIDEHDLKTDQGWWDHYTDPRFSRTLNGDWSLVELPFRVREAAHEIKLFITGEHFYPDSIIVDELLVRDARADVIRVDSISGDLWYNGHRLRP